MNMREAPVRTVLHDRQLSAVEADVEEFVGSELSDPAKSQYVRYTIPLTTARGSASTGPLQTNITASERNIRREYNSVDLFCASFLLLLSLLLPLLSL